MTNSSRWTRLRRWLRPDAEARRHLPLIAIPLLVFIAVVHFTTNRFFECDHYPDITTTGPGMQQYRCSSPRWELTCYHRIQGPMRDVCLKRLGPGANFVHHYKSFRDADCQAELGPQARVTGSAGCECAIALDRKGRCLSPERYCRSLYGKEAFPTVETSLDGTIDTFISLADPTNKENVIYGVCRCPEGMQFDTKASQCRRDSAG